MSRRRKGCVRFIPKLAPVFEAADENFEGPTFNIMLAGRSGLGKSTFIKCMFPRPDVEFNTDFDFAVSQHLIEEDQQLWLVSVIDTPGYQTGVNNENIWANHAAYIFSKQKNYFLNISEDDERVHVLIYFIDPSGLTPLDIMFLRHLNDTVNIIPVIAKADSLTFSETNILKIHTLQELMASEIQIYKFRNPNYMAGFLQERVPYTLMGSTHFVKKRGQNIRMREYAWGSVNIQSIEYCDFIYLDLALSSNYLYMVEDTAKLYHPKPIKPVPVSSEDLKMIIRNLESKKLKLNDELQKINKELDNFKELLDDTYYF